MLNKTTCWTHWKIMLCQYTMFAPFWHFLNMKLNIAVCQNSTISTHLYYSVTIYKSLDIAWNISKEGGEFKYFGNLHVKTFINQTDAWISSYDLRILFSEWWPLYIYIYMCQVTDFNKYKLHTTKLLNFLASI